MKDATNFGHLAIFAYEEALFTYNDGNPVKVVEISALMRAEVAEALKAQEEVLRKLDA